MSRARRLASWTCLAVAGLAALAISYSGLSGLAALCAFGAVGFLLPVAVDVTVIGASITWLAAGTPPAAWRVARRLALTAITTSVLANAVEHGITGGRWWWLAALVAAIPPGLLAALVHLGALLARHQAPEARQEASDAGADSTPRQPAPAPRQDRQAPGDDLVDRARSLLAAPGGPRLGRARLARELDISEHQARQVLDQLASESPGVVLPIRAGR